MDVFLYALEGSCELNVQFISPLLTGETVTHMAREDYRNDKQCKQALLQKFKLTCKAYKRKFLTLVSQLMISMEIMPSASILLICDAPTKNSVFGS